MDSHPSFSPVSWMRRRWFGLTLASQFLLAGATVLLAGMFTIGLWVTRQIEDSVVSNSASTTTLYVDSIIAPLFRNIETDRVVAEGAKRALDETLSMGELGRRIAFFKIWVNDGLIAYASEPELIGKKFALTDNLKKALNGQVSAEFDKLDDSENSTERVAGVPLLEIYSPIREPWSGKIVAVAEFYEFGSELVNELAAARLRSWLLVAAVTLLMLSLLWGIVVQGSRLIVDHRKTLEKQVADLSDLLEQNDGLRQRVLGASRRSAMLNERYLKRISADLHDGPAQLLALSLLRLDHTAAVDGTLLGGEMGVRDYLEEAMREIRDISRGLSLPQIETMTLNDLLSAAIAAHERRTSTAVALQLPDMTSDLTQTERICIYRFIQEGLSNAFRHAGGIGQSVKADLNGTTLVLSVADRGGGFDNERKLEVGLGLAGLHERVASIGGEFQVESSKSGTVLNMVLKLGSGDTK